MAQPKPRPERNHRHRTVRVLCTLARAVARRRCVAVRYRGRAGGEALLELEPDTLAFREGRWVLAARGFGEGEPKVLFVDRMLTARPVARDAGAPPPLAIRAEFALAELIGTGGPPPARTLRLAPRLAPFAGVLLPGVLSVRRAGGDAVLHLRGGGGEGLARLRAWLEEHDVGG